MSVRTIEQKMNAASVWNGAAPVGTPVSGSDMESYPEGAAGGLFDFENNNPITVKQIAIAFGSGTTSWKLELIDKDAVPVEVKAGTSLTYFANFASGEAGAGLILLEGQKLKLTSVGGPTTAARARVTVSSQVE